MMDKATRDASHAEGTHSFCTAADCAWIRSGLVNEAYVKPKTLCPHEPPPLAVPDPNSDTHVPVKARADALSLAYIAHDAITKAGVTGNDEIELMLLAAIESAYGDGFADGHHLSGICVTQEDSMATEGMYTECGNAFDKWMDCNRALGHLGDHAALVEADNREERDPAYGLIVNQVWPREGKHS